VDSLLRLAGAHRKAWVERGKKVLVDLPKVRPLLNDT
jgi:hypothetical protein